MSKGASHKAAQFRRVRKLFPHTEHTVFLNSAAHGPFCTPVHKALRDYVDLRLDAYRDDAAERAIRRDSLRSSYGKLIGAPQRSIGLAMNTSFGMNIAAFGLPFKRGDEVLVSDVEFPAAAYTFRAAAESRRLKLRFLPSVNKCFDIDVFEKAIRRRTRALVLSWVQFFNGYKNDLKTISEICKRHGLYLIVDGIQGMGVEPINVRKLGIDVFSTGCHKWMLSPEGCGFFYLSDEIRDTITPPFMSWLGVDWYQNYTDLFHYDRPYFDAARRYELGFHGVLNLIGMTAAVELFKELGVRNIQRHNYELIDSLVSFLQQDDFYRVTSSLEPKHRSSIVTFTCPGVKKLNARMTERRILSGFREGSIRISVHLFNSQKDIDILRELLEDFRRTA